MTRPNNSKWWHRAKLTYMTVEPTIQDVTAFTKMMAMP